MIVGGGFIAPRLTFANLDFKSVTPYFSAGDGVVVVEGSTEGVCVGSGRNLLATAYPALISLQPKLFGSLFHFCLRLVAVCKSCLFGGDLSVGGGRILFATLKPALASDNDRLFGSFRYF